MKLRRTRSLIGMGGKSKQTDKNLRTRLAVLYTPFSSGRARNILGKDPNRSSCQPTGKLLRVRDFFFEEKGLRKKKKKKIGYKKQTKLTSGLRIVASYEIRF